MDMENNEQNKMDLTRSNEEVVNAIKANRTKGRGHSRRGNENNKEEVKVDIRYNKKKMTF